MSLQSITMFYDHRCVLCHTEARRMQAYNPQQIHIIPVEEAAAKLAQAGISQKQALTYLCVQDSTGQWHTHMAAVRLLYRTAGLPFASWLYLPLIKPLGDKVYPWVARNRYCFPRWLVGMVYGKSAVQVATAAIAQSDHTPCKNGMCQRRP